MNLELMMRDARPTGGIWNLADVVTHLGRIKKPIIIRAAGNENALRQFETVADKLPWGSVVVFADADRKQNYDVVTTPAEWREWAPAGCEPHELMFVHSHGDNGYGTHQLYLLEAVRSTKGQVLELGAGDSSTAVLDTICGPWWSLMKTQDTRLLITVDNNMEWLRKFEHLRSDYHRLVHREDPATFLTESRDQHYGVIFIDHAPGHTRRNALKLARDCADLIVIHDTEDNGYQIWDGIESFKYKRSFRYMRPWTSVVSMKQQIFEDPYGKEPQ